MTWEINRDFAEGDSGIPVPGEAARHWQQIYEAKLEAEAKPMNIAPMSIAVFQAKVVAIAMDGSNKVAERLKAFELVIRISDQYAEELVSEHNRLPSGEAQR